MNNRRGFTLVELMVVIGIMSLITVITLVSVNFSFSRDKTREAARQIQSFLMGARDRAIHAKEARGVRFILSPNDKHTAVAMQYIGSGDRLEQGVLTYRAMPPLSPNGAADVVQIPNAANLESKGVLGIGSQIEIPRRSGNYFTVTSKVFSALPATNLVMLNKQTPTYNGLDSTVDYSLVLKPMAIGSAEPTSFPAGVAIDLDGSQLPLSWRPSSADSTKPYRPTLDIMFNPRGNVIGDVASGTVHLLLADTGDISKWTQISGRRQIASPGSQWAPPAVPVNPPGVTPAVVNRDQMIVTIRGNTGAVSVHSVDPTPNGTNTAIADDPFSFADAGISAK